MISWIWNCLSPTCPFISAMMEVWREGTGSTVAGATPTHAPAQYLGALCHGGRGGRPEALDPHRLSGPPHRRGEPGPTATRRPAPHHRRSPPDHQTAGR